ncbi:MAG: Flp pilus assembly protein CpaB, partial [Halobacteriales archaeon]|nr:Flp pilus assembly protein CpaB [Halobacteriales archaeon]
ARVWLILTLALLSGAVAGYLALDFLRDRMQTVAVAPSDTVPVVVASRDLPAGTILSGTDVRVARYPADAAPAGRASNPDEIVGRGVVTPIYADEPLISAKIAGEGSGGGLPVVIPKGMRAVSVEVDEVIGVAGFVQSTTRVDVIVTINPTSGRENARSKVILQNIEVAAAGQTTERDAQGRAQTVPVITLLVTPEQAEKLTLAATEGRIRLALRNVLDHEEISTAGVQAAALVRPDGGESSPRPRPVVRRSRPSASQSFAVETYDGTDRSVSTF